MSLVVSRYTNFAFGRLTRAAPRGIVDQRRQLDDDICHSLADHLVEFHAEQVGCGMIWQIDRAVLVETNDPGGDTL